MITTASPEHERSERTTEPTKRGSLSRLIGPAVITLVVGLAVARFLSAGSSPPKEPTASMILDDLRTTAESQKTSVESWIRYGNASMQAAVASGDRDEYFAARDAFDTAVRLAPDSAEALTAKAGFELNAHDFVEALTFAERAVELNPYSSAALAALVDARVETGRYEQADEALAQLLAREPGVAAYARVSYLRELRGDLDGARVAMQQAVASAGVGPDRATVLVYLGELQLDTGRIDAADDAFRQALADSPGHAAATVGQARVMIARGLLDEAATHLELAIELGPETTPAIVSGELALLRGDLDRANADFATAQAKDDLLRARGEATDLESSWFLADHGGSGEALIRARAAYEVRPTVLGADALAWALYNAGDIPQARQLIDKALIDGNRMPFVRVHAAAIFAAAQDLDRARLELAVAFEGTPWTALSTIPIATDLAARLGIHMPDTWSLRAR